ncbi:MAG: ABC transporter ATP-binding protein [Bacteroidaceae bacterium]|nr:ABC transporter ATP-binding protein [Bacteroidaceae bacterium]
MKYVLWVWRNMAGIRWNTVVRIAIGISQVLLGLLMVWLSKRFIDVTIRTGDDSDIVKMVLMLVATVLGGILLRQVYYYMSTAANTRQTNAIRLRIFSNLFRRQMYEEKLHSGDITSRLEKDLDAIADVTTSSFPQFVIMTFQMLGAFFLMKSMDARLAWALLLLTPLFLVFGKVLAHKLKNMTMDIRQQESLIQMLVQEGMEHNEVLRSLESEDWVTDRLDEMQRRLKGKVLKRTRFTAMTRILLASSFSMGYLLAFIWGGLQLRDGVITFGVMTSFLQLVSQLQHPILNLLNMIPQFIHASASITRLQELEDAGKEALANRSTEMLDGQVGVKVTGLHFSYATGDRLIFNNFSQDFRPGSKTALMGQTGAGKTTLFRLMLGLAEPERGSVEVYNQKKSVGVSANTRSNFVFVPQGNTLMSGTVRYNLLLANPMATDEELTKVLHTAMADFVFDQPNGLDTELGERGIGLSEGQAQRIAIARGLLRPGSVLLLDEISSSLDGQTERQLFEHLFRDYPDKTMIFITHRTEVCKLCDEVISLTPST